MFGFQFIWAMCGNIFDQSIPTDKRAKMENDYLFIIYFNQLVNYSLSMFEWENLPSELKEHIRYIEMVLLFTGAGAMYYDTEFERFDFLQMIPNGTFDRYGNQLKYSARGYNGYHVDLTVDDSVICWNSYTRTASLIPTIFSFAERLADVQRTIDVRLDHHKVPVMFKGNKNNQLTLRNIFKKRQAHEPVVFTDESLDYTNSQVMPTDPEFIIKDLWSYKKDLWNEAMLFIGVDNAKTEKKERMIEAEVQSNDEQIVLARDIMLNSRIDFCKAVNEKWGLNINVKFREPSMDKKQEESEVTPYDSTI